MQTRRIGSLDVSVVGLGCNNFGERLDRERSVEVVHAALDAGINFLDTADIYTMGRSEEFIGEAIAGRRDEVLIGTKFGYPFKGEPAGTGSGAVWIRDAVEGSLRRLGTDRIDLFQQHVPDPTVPIEETLATLDELVRAGKVREIGSSNFGGPTRGGRRRQRPTGGPASPACRTATTFSTAGPAPTSCRPAPSGAWRSSRSTPWPPAC